MRRHSSTIFLSTLAILLLHGTARAVDVTCGQTLERTIERGSKSDVLSYEGGVNDVLSITVVAVAPDPDCKVVFDPYWELFDPEGRRVAIPLGDDGRRCLGVEQGQGQCETEPLTESSELGPYTLVVTDFGKNCSGTYRVTVENVSGTVNGAPFDPEHPPCSLFNEFGKPDGTQPITPSVEVAGAIDENGETDTFTFQGHAGETVPIRLVADEPVPSGFHLRWTLFDPAGNAVSDDCSTITCDRGPLVDGVYTIKVFDSELDSTGGYILTLQPNDVTTTTTTTTSSTLEVSSTTSTTLQGSGSGQPLYELSRTLRRTTSDFAPSEALGTSLASDGSVLVIGSPLDQSQQGTVGAAFVVNLAGAPSAPTYGQLRRTLTKPGGSSLNDRFGAAVAVLGTSVVVGAPGADSTAGGAVADAGEVYVFTEESPNPARILWPAVTGSDFGASLVVFGSELLVGAPAQGGFGKVYLFNGTSLSQVFDGTQAGTGAAKAGDQFGFAIAARQDELAIGAPATGSGRFGSVFILDRVTGQWRVVQSASPAPNDQFGAALLYVNSTLFVGAPGAGKVFRLADTGDVAADVGLGPRGGLGTSLALAAGDLVIGAPSAGQQGAQGGQVVQIHLDGTPVATYAKDAPEGGDQFGHALAGAGDQLFVGVPGDDSGNVDGGAVYAYQLLNTVPEAIFRKRLTDAGFGTTVAADTTTIAIGAPTDANGDGAVYSFDPQGPCTDGVCIALGMPLRGKDGSRFGQSLAMLDGTALVGAPFEDAGATLDAGAAYLIQRTQIGPRLSNPQASAGDQFGFAVATVGDDLLIGAPLETSTDTGAVYVFDKQDLGHSRLVLHKPVPTTGDFFGSAIAGEGDTVAVGAPFDNSAAPNAGAVYLFKRSNADLLTDEPLVSPQPIERELFGAAVAVSADLIVVGAPIEDGGTQRAGRVYVFKRESLALLGIIENPTGIVDDKFGAAVTTITLDNGEEDVLIGAPMADAGAENTGTVYLIDPRTGRPRQQFLNPVRGAFDRFGTSVAPALSGMVIGAPGPGRAYLFRSVATAGIARNAVGVAAAAAGPRCGNGIIEGAEQCDDGNNVDTDDCRNNCTLQGCCVIDPLAADRCNDFDPCTDDSFDAKGQCVNVSNGLCCSSDASCAGDSACRVCAGCSLFPWDCCDEGSTCILNSAECEDKTCFDEAACECQGKFTCAKPTQAMNTAFGDACDDLRHVNDTPSDTPLASARMASREARRKLKLAVRETRNAYKDQQFSKECRAQFIADIRLVRKSIPTGQKLRKCVSQSKTED